MNRCKTCKWWDEEPVYNTPRNKVASVFHYCRNLKIDATGDEENAMFGITQTGMDAGYVGIATGPEFGCVHHELKD